MREVCGLVLLIFYNETLADAHIYLPVNKALLAVKHQVTVHSSLLGNV